MWPVTVLYCGKGLSTGQGRIGISFMKTCAPRLSGMNERAVYVTLVVTTFTCYDTVRLFLGFCLKTSNQFHKQHIVQRD